jgi:hypothetical protein
MTTEEIAALITRLGHLADVLHRADPADKAAVYQQLGLTMTYQYQTHTIQVDTRPNQKHPGPLAIRPGDRALLTSQALHGEHLSDHLPSTKS